MHRQGGSAMIVRKFLDWMETAPAGRRAEAAHALARAYLYSTVDEETHSGMEAAMTLLLDDPAPQVRFALCDALGSSPDAPRHVISALVNGQLDIAETVLARSPVFIDAELVDIVATADGSLQMAIASRPSVSGAVAGALAEVGVRESCRVLVARQNAMLPPSVLRRIAQRFGDEPSMRDLLLRRAELPADVHQLLVRQLGDALAGLVVQKGYISPERARRVRRDACDRATVAIASRSGRSSMPALVEHLRLTGQLTTEILLRSVCSGQVALFEAALVNLTRTPEGRVARLVRRGGNNAAFRAVYTKAGLPASVLAAFAAALDAWRRLAGDERRDRYSSTMRIINAVMERYARDTDGNMTEMAAILRRFAADQARDAARDHARLPPPAAAAA